MKIKYLLYSSVLSLCLLPPVLQAKVSQEKASKLGGDKYTCMGALRAGTSDGGAKYTGKWLKSFPGSTKGQGWPGNPYKNEKPRFVITASNMEQYSDHLTAGEKALLKKYPKEFKMPVYKSHRDFRFPSYVCDTIKDNALHAEIVHDGLGVSGKSGAPPFPFPENGLQAIWNVIDAVRSWTSEVTYDTADVFSSGDISWGRTRFLTMNPGNNPNGDRGTYQDHISAYFYHGTRKPAKDNGKIAVGYQPNDYSEDDTQSWQYRPGIRRVRKAPEIGFDYPIPPNGLRVVSGDYIFNGSPEHFNWKLEGKTQVYVPYNNFRFNKPGIPYDKLLLAHTANPKYIRYELHKVWKLVGTRKSDIRDIYNKRVIYVDPDSWLALWGDNYDNHDNLYRVAYIMYFYSQISGTYFRGASIYQDLHKDAYEATYLTNESDKFWQINIPLHKSQFSPRAAARHGH